MRMRKENDKKLYETIMTSISKEIKKAINESSIASEKVYGVYLVNDYEDDSISMDNDDFTLYKNYGDAKAAALDKITAGPSYIENYLLDITDAKTNTLYMCNVEASNPNSFNAIDVKGKSVYVTEDEDPYIDNYVNSGLCYILQAFSLH